MGTSSAVRSVALRLEVQGDDVVVRKLDQVGKGGEAAMGRLKQSARDVPAHLKAVSSISDDVKTQMTALGGRAGMAGNALMAMGPIGMGLAATLGAVALAANAAFSKTAESMKFADALEEQSKRLRVGMEDLQGWQAVAHETDVSAEALASAFVRIKEKSDEYVAGLLRAKESRPFQLLGITREDMALARDVTEQLLLIAAGLQNIAASQRQGVLEKLGLGEMGPLLEQGPDKIREMIEEARRSGMVLKDNVVKPLADAYEESEKIEKKIANDWARALKGLAPTMNWFKEQWADIAGAIADAVNPLEEDTRKGLQQRIARATEVINNKGVGGGFYDPGNPFSTKQDIIDAAFRDRAEAQAQLDAMNRKPLKPYHLSVENMVKDGFLPKSALKLPPTAEELAKAEEDQKRAEAEAKRRAEEQRRLQEQRTAFIDRLGQTEAAADREATVAQARANADKLRGKAGYYQAVADMIRVSADAEVKEVEAAAKTELDQLAKLEAAFKKAGLAVPEDLATQQKTIERIRDKKTGAIRERQGYEAADNAKEARGELGHLVDQLNGPLDGAMNKAAAQGLSSFEDALVGIATGAKSASQAVSEMARSIIADLMRIVIRQTIMRPLSQWVEGLFASSGSSVQSGTIFSSTGSNGQSGGSTSVISSGLSYLGSLFGGGKADGGKVNAGTMYEVNERGMETFWAGRSGYVLDHGSSVAAIANEVGKRVMPVVSVTTAAPTVELHNHGEALQVASQSYDESSNRMRLDFRRDVPKAVAASVRGGDVDSAMGDRFGMSPTLKRRT